MTARADAPRARSATTLLLVVLVAFALRIALIVAVPALPPGDSYARVLTPTTLIRGGWLPGYQATLALLSVFANTPEAFRVWTAAQGAAAAGAAYVAGRAALGSRAGLLLGLAAALLPTFVLPAIGLYQEPLFVALAATGVHLVRDPRTERAGVVVIGLASLVRYEGWVLAGFVGAWLVADRRAWGPALACLMVPVGWLVYDIAGPVGMLEHANAGVSTQRVVDRVVILLRLSRELWLLPLLVCALAGAVTRRRLGWLLTFGAADFAMLAFFDPWSPSDNPRQLCIPLGIALYCAASWAADGGWRTVVAAGTLAAGAAAWPRALAALSHDADLPVALARALAPGLGNGDTVLVIAEGLRGWPDAAPAECEMVKAYAGSESVICDPNVQLAGPKEMPTWLALHHVRYVVRLGDWVAWRPAQRALEAVVPGWVVAADVPGRLTVHARDRESAALVDIAAVAELVAREPAQPCASTDPTPVQPDAVLEGAAVRSEGGRVAFYTNGTMTFIASEPGTLQVDTCGTPADGRQPRFTVSVGERTTAGEAPAHTTRLPIGAVLVGDSVVIRYDDDGVGVNGDDRNLYVRGVSIEAAAATDPTTPG